MYYIEIDMEPIYFNAKKPECYRWYLMYRDESTSSETQISVGVGESIDDAFKRAKERYNEQLEYDLEGKLKEYESHWENT